MTNDIFSSTHELCEEYKDLRKIRFEDDNTVGRDFNYRKIEGLEMNLLGRQSVFMAWKEHFLNDTFSNQILDAKIDKALKEIEETLK